VVYGGNIEITGISRIFKVSVSGDTVIEGTITQTSTVTCGSIVTERNIPLKFKRVVFIQILKLLMLGVFNKFPFKF
jgi:hypothetical protein